MNFFDKFLSVLGFESKERAQDEVKQPKKKTKNLKLNSSFNLKSNSHNRRLPATRNISSQDQVAFVLDELKEKSAIIIDISGFEKNLRIRAYDFICGAVYALGGQMKKIDVNKYLCSLDDVSSFMEEIL